jgi:CDP-diacylglycerol--glycerol-3-phosphate 3-phosphatidyltransferase
VISSSRVLLAAGFALVTDVDKRLGLVGIAAVTDVLDGWLARRAKWTTRLGALIDPMADRIFAVVAVLTFIETGALSFWAAIVMLSRDIMTAIGFLVARAVSWLRPVQLRARRAGKLVTMLQFIAFVVLLLAPQRIQPLLWLVGLASAYSVYDYTLALWHARVR